MDRKEPTFSGLEMLREGAFEWWVHSLVAIEVHHDFGPRQDIYGRSEHHSAYQI